MNILYKTAKRETFDLLEFTNVPPQPWSCPDFTKTEEKGQIFYESTFWLTGDKKQWHVTWLIVSNNRIECLVVLLAFSR